MEQVRQKIKMQGFKSSKKADNKSVLSQVIPVFTIPGPHMYMYDCIHNGDCDGQYKYKPLHPNSQHWVDTR